MNYSRLIICIGLLAVILCIGTFGYAYFESMPIYDAFYMTVITISTVGFSEVKPLSNVGRAITIIIIISGITILTYTLGQIFKIFLEGEMLRILGRRKLEKQIAGLTNHFIICGYGRIGEIISKELVAENIPFVVIEEDSNKIDQMEKDQVIYLNKDATSDDALRKAGIAHAKGLVAAVQSDADNVFITLSAKGLQPDIFVLARASDEKNQEKLVRAGANRVVSPYLLGGRRMAQILKSPTVVDFIDTATVDSPLGLRMEEAVIGSESYIAGKNLIDSHLRKDFGVIIAAIKKPTNEMIFNPTPNEILEAGDILVAIGKTEDLKRMNAALK